MERYTTPQTFLEHDAVLVLLKSKDFAVLVRLGDDVAGVVLGY